MDLRIVFSQMSTKFQPIQSTDGCSGATFEGKIRKPKFKGRGLDITERAGRLEFPRLNFIINDTCHRHSSSQRMHTELRTWLTYMRVYIFIRLHNYASYKKWINTFHHPLRFLTILPQLFWACLSRCSSVARFKRRRRQRKTIHYLECKESDLYVYEELRVFRLLASL